MKRVIWSNFESSPYIEQKIIKEGYVLGKIKDDELAYIIKKYELNNNRLLEEVVKIQFSQIYENPLLSLSVIWDGGGNRLGQEALLIGENLNNIFNIPYDKVTWYIDGWNIKANVLYNGMFLDYTFREIKEINKLEFFLENINSKKKLLTPTYMGLYTKTLCADKRK